jgi:spore germination protein GerM
MRVRVAVGVLVVALLLAACGVDSQDGPVAVKRDDVPFGLLDATTTTTTRPRVGGNGLVVYLVSPSGLVGAVRKTKQVPTGAIALSQLESGPTPAESAAGLVTTLTGGAVSLVDVRQGRATVRLDSSFEGRQAIPLQTVAQVVLTLTSVATIGQVVFEINGERVEVPRGDGTTTGVPVGAADYQSMVAPA